MPHNPAKLLEDILSAGRAIQQFTAGRTLDDYRNDLLMRSGTERQFEIIGEALNRLGRLDSAFMAHGYDILESAIVWQVINDYLPKLLSRAADLLHEIEENQPDDPPGT